MAYSITPISTRNVGITIGADKHIPAIIALTLSEGNVRLYLLIK
tara:strand:+ start:383 stop:514 length:132 start_codon:yes stop_codon:yes gene_type:complete